MYLTHSSEETITLASKIGSQLPKNSIICLFGNLAAGKTTFIKGLAQGFAGINIDQVSSPTFIYLNIYAGILARTIYHFDLYRLQNSDEFLSLGFEEFFFADGLCCIEWSERIADILPDSYLSISLSHIEENQRQIVLEKINFNEKIFI